MHKNTKRKIVPEAELRTLERARLRKQMLKKYGLTPETYQAMSDAQAGLCAICQRPGVPWLCVDHCHTTGKVRELLCQTCNAGIGMLQDREELCMIAAAYLRRHLPSC